MLMMTPLRCARITGATALLHSHVPRTLTAMTRSHSSIGISSKLFRGWTSWVKMAALLMSASIRPYARSVAATIAWTLESSDTST
jgi:hypothetical protein